MVHSFVFLSKIPNRSAKVKVNGLLYRARKDGLIKLYPPSLYLTSDCFFNELLTWNRFDLFHSFIDT